jgi:Yip1 domain
MTEAVIPPEASTAPLSQGQRVVDTFIAPSKTFTDIVRNSSWWLPFLIGVVVTLAFGFAVQQKIGWDKTYENILRQSPSQMARIDQMPAEQQAKAKQMGAAFTKGIFWATPVFAVIVALICAGVLLGTINFGFGGRAKFGQMLAVWFYGTLPWAIQGLLGIVTVYAGVDPDSFNLKNFVGTNIGYYLPTDLPKWLIAGATAIDVFTIWALILLTIGCSIVGKISRGKAAGAIWGWWIITVLFKIVGASFS